MFDKAFSRSTRAIDSHRCASIADKIKDNYNINFLKKLKES